MVQPIDLDERRRIRGAVGSATNTPLNTGGPGGTSGGMETWPASIDRRVGQAETDVRTLLNRGAIAVVALAAMIGGLYLFVGAQDRDIERRLSAVEATVSRLDERTASMQKQQDDMDGKLDKLLQK